MPVRFRCPHCRTPCLVAEQHRGVPVQCGRCGRTFTTRADPKATMACVAPVPRVRLDLGAAGSPRRSPQGDEDSFLAQHSIYCNLEARHELAVLAAADRSRAISAVAAALAPLLGELFDGSNKDATRAAETLAAACKNLTSTVSIAVIWDGRVSLSRCGETPIYHYSGGHLNRLSGDSIHLAIGDYLVLTGTGPRTSFDDAILAEIAAARSSALELAQLLVERVGGDACTFVVARGI